MARSGDLGWAGSGIWARREGLGKAKKGEPRKKMGSRRKMRENSPV